MMPTRLQDGVSVSLLQWMRSAGADEKRIVTVRAAEAESMTHIARVLETAGMENIEPISPAAVRGSVTAESLSRVAHCFGVCSVTEAR